VSLYNETDKRAILPTPTVAAVGQVRDENCIVSAWFREAGDEIVLLGQAVCEGLGGSEYVMHHTGKVQGPAPRIDLDLERRLQELVVDLAENQLIASAHDVSDGGLAVALAECATLPDDDRRMLGAAVELPAGGAAALFGEAPSRIVVSARPEHVAAIEARAQALGVAVLRLGRSGGDRLQIRAQGRTLIDVPLAAAREARERCLEPIVGS
jgi:phosphoribosylformylglycinamidine synthase